MLNFTVTFGITVVNLVILFFILKAILFKPLTKFINERGAKIQNDIDQAAKDREQAKILLEQYETKLKEASAEADRIIHKARAEAVVQADQITAEGKEKADAFFADAQRKIEAERKAGAAIFKAQAARLVITAASRLIQRNLDKEDAKNFANLLINELGEREIRL